MGHLRGKRVYVAGPIENAGVEDWRPGPVRVLREEFGLDVFDPAADEKQIHAGTLAEARRSRDYETMARIANEFVAKDLTIVSRCDLVVACLPYRVPTTGTVHEIIWKSMDKSPTLLVCPQGKEFLPYWFYGWIDWRDSMFGSWDEMYDLLRRVDSGEYESKKWRFIQGKL